MLDIVIVFFIYIWLKLKDWINLYNYSVIDMNLNIIKILNVLNDEVMYCLVVLFYFLYLSCIIYFYLLFVNWVENEW